MDFLWNEDDLLSDDDEQSISKKDQFDLGRRMFTFLIDTDTTMFDNNSKYILLTIKAIQEVLMKCVRESRTDLISIILFNTNDNTKASNFEHITNLIPQGDLNAEKIRKLEKLIETNNLNDLTKYMCDSESLKNKNVIKNVLWYARSLRDKVNLKISNHSITMFTAQFEPNEDIKLILQQANDMSNNSKDHFNVIGFGDFDYNLLYKDVILRVNNLSKETWKQPVHYNSVETIVSNINTYKNNMRCFARLNLHLGSDVALKVSLYNITKSKYSLMPMTTYITKADNTKVQSNNVLESKDTGELVLKNEISYYTKVQGEMLFFSPEEKSLIQNFSTQGIKVLGFIDSARIKPYYTLGHSALVIPTEPEDYKLFTFLLKKCAERSYSIMCSVVYRKTGKPRLATLIPHMENEKYPNAFFLKPLPYSDNIRSNVLSTLKQFNEQVTASGVDNKRSQALNIIKTFVDPNFEVGSIREPKSDWKWNAVEALALQRDDLVKCEDETLPKKRGLKRINDF